MRNTHFIAIFAILFAFCATSCCPKVLPSAVEVVRDTTIIEKAIIMRDTTILYLPSQEIHENTTKDSTSVLRTSIAISTAAITPEGSLHHTLENTTDPIVITLQIPTQHVNTSYLSSSFNRVPVPVPAEWTKWQSFVQVVGYLALLVLLLRVLLKYLKKLFKNL